MLAKAYIWIFKNDRLRLSFFLSTATKKIKFGFAAFSPAAFSVSSIIRSSFSCVEVGWEVPSPSQPNKMELRVSLSLSWSGVLRQTTDLLFNSTYIHRTYSMPN